MGAGQAAVDSMMDFVRAKTVSIQHSSRPTEHRCKARTLCVVQQCGRRYDKDNM